MNFLLDTNVLSEVHKSTRRNQHVAAWWASVDARSLSTSVLVIGEIRRGIEQVRPRDPERASAFETVLTEIRHRFAERILPIDADVAEEWGRMNARRTVSVIDGLLAATAKTRGLTLVTRNIADVADLGAELFNPFEAV